MDVKFIIENIPIYTKATWITLYLAFAGIVISIIIGGICSILIYFRVPTLSKIAKCYIEISRNTPLLIQLFFLYYGLTKVGIHLNGFTCGIIGLSFSGGSYMSEAFSCGRFNVCSKRFNRNVLQDK